MKQMKKIFHWFEIAAYDEELGFLNAMSDQGWQFTAKPGFRQTYIRDDGARYRYAVFDRRMPPEDGANWEFVDCYHKMYLFRRRYDPALPEDSYILMKDPDALMALKRKTGLLVTPLATLGYLFLFFLRLTGAARILVLISILLGIVRYVASIRHIKNAGACPAPFRRHPWRYLHCVSAFLILAACAVGYFFPAPHDTLPGFVSILLFIMILIGGITAFVLAMDQESD